MVDSNANYTDIYKQERQRLLTKIDRYRREIEEDEKKVQALEILIGDAPRSIVEDHYDRAPIGYPLGGTYTEKLKFVLEELGEGTAKEIADKIIEIEGIENETTIRTLRNTITLYCSRLLSEYVLRARQVGKTNVYFLDDDGDF